MSATIEEIIEMVAARTDAAPTTSAKPRRHRRPKAVRLQDVAKAAGVSVATVSMVVNNNPRISPATKKRVQRFIEQLGYLPNRSAQIVSGARQPVARGLCFRRSGTRLRMSIWRTHQRHRRCRSQAGAGDRRSNAPTPEFIRSNEARWRCSTRSRRMGCSSSARATCIVSMDDFAGTKAPVVAVDSKLARPGAIDTVGCDYRSGAQQAMNYLLQLGHAKNRSSSPRRAADAARATSFEVYPRDDGHLRREAARKIGSSTGRPDRRRRRRSGGVHAPQTSGDHRDLRRQR
jgi:hypothetical protein